MSWQRAIGPPGWPSRATARRGVVTHWYGYDLALLKIENDRMTVAGRRRGRARAARGRP